MKRKVQIIRKKIIWINHRLEIRLEDQKVRQIQFLVYSINLDYFLIKNQIKVPKLLKIWKIMLVQNLIKKYYRKKILLVQVAK